MGLAPSGTAGTGAEQEKDEPVEFESAAKVGESRAATTRVILSKTSAANREKALSQGVEFTEIKQVCFLDAALSTEETCVYRCDIYIDGRLTQSNRLRSELREGGLCPPNFTDIKVVPK